VIEVEESYTSKCDALALESIQKHKKYLSKRVKRGLFQFCVPTCRAYIHSYKPSHKGSFLYNS